MYNYKTGKHLIWLKNNKSTAQDEIDTYLERADKWLVDRHQGSSIVEFTTVIRCWKEGDQLAFGKEFVAVFDNLPMGKDIKHIKTTID